MTITIWLLCGILVGVTLGQISVWSYIKRKCKHGAARVLHEGASYIYIERRKLSPIELARFEVKADKEE